MESKINRREWLKTTGTFATGVVLSNFITGCVKKNNPIILLRSGWQVENIGDIAHTPGFLAILEKHIPDTQPIYWHFYHYLPEDEVALIKRRFPNVQIVQGNMDAEGKASTLELEQAFTSADIFINNSGPATLGWAEASMFKKKTGKPFGVYGVTYGLYGTPEKAVLSEADFLYFRDSVSLARAKSEGINAPIMEFGPDAAFGIDITDDTSANKFLKANGLEEGKFLCCIPKHRHTPTWLHKHKNRPFDEQRHKRNEEMRERDHAPMIEAINTIVRGTDLKVLIVHEDETQIPIGKEWLLDKLPEDVKTKVVWRDYGWLPDEAVSIYKKSAGYFGNEMHSPIMCIGNGVPAIVGRWEEQSSKGMMWQDIGLGEWLFDFDNEKDIKRYVPTVLALAKDPVAAKAKVKEAQKFLHERQTETMKVLKSSIKNR
jgi:hypothetical protein